MLDQFPNFFYVVPDLVEHNSHLIEFDDVCGFFVIFTLYSHIASMRTINFHNDFYGNVNNIKSHIKFVTMRRGFKIGFHILFRYGQSLS